MTLAGLCAGEAVRHDAQMIWRTRRLSALTCAIVLVGSVAACRDDSTSTTAGATVATTAATGSPAAPASATAATGSGSSEFCAVVEKQRALLQGTGLSTLLTGGQPAAWKAYLAQMGELNQELVDASPPEIAASVKTLQATTVELKSTMAAAGYDVSKVGAAKLVALMRSTRQTDATTRLVAYTKANCGIDLSKVTG